MTNEVRSQILAIRETGLTNMFDVHTVQRLAYDRSFWDLVLYLENNKMEYFDFIRTGKAPMETQTSDEDDVRNCESEK